MSDLFCANCGRIIGSIKDNIVTHKYEKGDNGMPLWPDHFDLNKLMNISYSDFEKMPLFVRKYLLDKWIEDNNKD
jgi:hypothetical protein